MLGFSPQSSAPISGTESIYVFYSMSTDVAAYVDAAQDVTLLTTSVVTVDLASYGYAAQDVNGLRTLTIDSNLAAYTYAAQDVSTIFGYFIAVNTSIFNCDMSEVTLTAYLGTQRWIEESPVSSTWVEEVAL